MPRISLSSARRAGLAVALLLLAFGPAQAQSNAPPAFRLLAFGDSLIHGYGLASGQTLPERLEAALEARGLSVEVINGGNSGDTTASGRTRLDWTLGGSRTTSRWSRSAATTRCAASTRRRPTTTWTPS